MAIHPQTQVELVKPQVKDLIPPNSPHTLSPIAITYRAFPEHVLHSRIHSHIPYTAYHHLAKPLEPVKLNFCNLLIMRRFVSEHAYIP